ncbi:energy transducer TonB [Tenacibaculum sp. MEBiC06402]|uniref:energy transducer TonB n=1 Tax=unclassified Tenacibaculum TaxID=2635139 RepID=UPI003B9A6436
MKKVTWLLFSLFMINSAFGQSDNDHTVKIKKSKNSSKNIEVEIVYKKKTVEKPTTITPEASSLDKTRFLIKRKEITTDIPLEEKVVSKPVKVKSEKKVENTSVFTFDKVDRVPVFSSCKVNGKKSSNKCFKSGISKFIQENFEYPEEAIEDGTTGKVTVKFTINKEGKVVNVIATDANNIKTLTDYSVELISKLPKLEAAQKDGKAVAASYEFQLDFSL